MKNTKGSRSRPSGGGGGGTDRGGIRKRGPTRMDRDGDMDMDAAGGARNRGGKRVRGGDSARSSTAAGRTPAMDVIQKALSDNTTNSQATIRQGRKGAGSSLEHVSVRGWKQSKAASNRDGGLESLITFLEKKLNAPDSKASSRARITKVCVKKKVQVTPETGGHRLSLRMCSLSRFQRMASFSKRRIDTTWDTFFFDFFSLCCRFFQGSLCLANFQLLSRGLKAML